MQVSKDKVKKLTENVAYKALKKARKAEALATDPVQALAARITRLETALHELQNNYDDLKLKYESHKHDYIDTTINDTADGTGTATQTTKTTSTTIS